MVKSRKNLYFGKKAPAMPENVKEFIVKYSPYLYLLVLILTIPAILLAFGLTAVAMPLAYVGGFQSGFSFSVTALISLAALVLGAMAIPGLFKRTQMSWKYMFYASLLSLLSYLLDLKLASVIINGIISFYILFQIKSYYKN